MDDISTLLREIKAATALTEAQLAVDLGTTQPTINRILNGQLGCKIAMYRAIVAMHATKCMSVDGHPSNSIPPPHGNSLALSD